MWVLFILSVSAVAIAFAKLYQFRVSDLGELKKLPEVISKARGGDFKGARDILSQSPSPVARVAESALSAVATPGLTIESINAEVQRVGTQEIRNIESWLRPLASISQLAPLIGLLGTIFGMITSFQAMETATSVNPALLAGGIWEALLTTAFGLLIAIPCMAMYHYLEGEVDKVKAYMRSAATQLLVQFGPRHNPSLLEGDNLSAQELRDQYGV